VINDLWYKNAIIYCLSVGSFMDANGDGVGDFPGLMRRLDYLHGLGVTAIWLMPFQPTPLREEARGGLRARVPQSAARKRGRGSAQNCKCSVKAEVSSPREFRHAPRNKTTIRMITRIVPKPPPT
jgi:hypothetical protein